MQLNASSHFTNDLGLDSLDTVEVVMAIEEVSVGYDWWISRWKLMENQEFSIEIPDKEADAIHSGMQDVEYMRNGTDSGYSRTSC